MTRIFFCTSRKQSQTWPISACDHPKRAGHGRFQKVIKILCRPASIYGQDCFEENFKILQKVPLALKVSICTNSWSMCVKHYLPVTSPVQYKCYLFQIACFVNWSPMAAVIVSPPITKGIAILKNLESELFVLDAISKA